MTPITNITNCSANDPELGPCERFCGRRLCALRSTCVRPVVEVKRSLWDRLQRWRGIRRAQAKVAYLEMQYRQIAAGTPTERSRWPAWLSVQIVYTPEQLRAMRDQVAAARVDLSLAQRP